ncbi:archaeal transcription regulator [Thermococcus kodakarensis KOD1]|uniref:Putative transcriptional regulatory protein TK2151 n=1 Tax=Thermococcus kodakarensis (strain ATCC BAA-918 / JCM 12380 / KOD1) TaxID=69014 RepID=Y2151_THEKO|nr:Tfx family DNA-binding protein [Thermococcus kodakarensis]Q5JHH2.1 RecName: Full=Putative transcriptional regulatory protein TK2151 [Thermococcus kodakarensis KOD1]WCN29459.1 Tfx family DNA-binding protein [Thermococcus kodakarensis]WCN31741.1 Tfx family DNA-binding protein [Thermococcus kodakarensis]BAD86340.1 archaeal transcription regulator [Thermococcus kodakarensis KOD1]
MKSFLTEQQIRVLQLRAKGLKQSEIAEILGTSRANVSILERRALEKIEKARNTLLLWEQINSKISVEVKKGEDIFQVPEKLFKKADELGVKVPYSTAEIIAFLVEHAPIDDRLAKRDFTLFLDREDRLRVSECILEDFDEIGKHEGGKDTI